jgi:hypothetical protein
MKLTYRKLRELSDDRIMDMYDAEAEHVDLPLNFLRDEILRRAQEKHDATIVKQTATMMRLTWVITFMTVVVTVATVFMAVRG